ncbi:MAG: hypothetical protein IGNPGNKH_00197 [Sodalis sp. Ffu]|nr:MAG: hypothetical protein IGNPGNKH_00197 [Sodalis sp. Ffu]
MRLRNFVVRRSAPLPKYSVVPIDCSVCTALLTCRQQTNTDTLKITGLVRQARYRDDIAQI